MTLRLLQFARAMRQEPTAAERVLWRALRARQVGGLKWRRQHPVERYILDFYCAEARLVVEVDGETHAEAARDELRDRWLGERGLRVLRVTNRDTMANLPGVLEAIAACVPGRSAEVCPERF